MNFVVGYFLPQGTQGFHKGHEGVFFSTFYICEFCGWIFFTTRDTRVSQRTQRRYLQHFIFVNFVVGYFLPQGTQGFHKEHKGVFFQYFIICELCG